MRKLASGLIVTLTEPVLDVCVVPWLVAVTGRFHVLPSSLWNATVTGAAEDEVFTSVTTVDHPSPAAI
jgi:hypothetical protein